MKFKKKKPRAAAVYGGVWKKVDSSCQRLTPLATGGAMQQANKCHTLTKMPSSRTYRKRHDVTKPGIDRWDYYNHPYDGILASEG